MSSSRHSYLDLGPHTALPPPVRAFRTVLLLAHRLRQSMDERLRPDGLTTQQAALLTAVKTLGRPSLGEAAKALGTSHQNVAQLVASLQHKGFLTVERDSADQRRRRLSVTEASAQYWRARDTADEEAIAGWFAPLSVAELATLSSLADRVLAHLDGDGPIGS